MTELHHMFQDALSRVEAIEEERAAEATERMEQLARLHHRIDAVRSEVSLSAERTASEFQRLEEHVVDLGVEASAAVEALHESTSVAIPSPQQLRAAKESGGDGRNPRQVWSEVEFVKRRSLFDAMLTSSNPDFLTMYHMGVAALVWMAVNVLTTDLMEEGRMAADWEMLMWTIERLDAAVPAWMFLFTLSLSVVPFVLIVHSAGLTMRTWLPLYVLQLVLVFTYGTYVCLATTGMSVPLSVALACEMVRMLLKMHAYVREKLLHGRATMARLQLEAGADMDGADEGKRGSSAQRGGGSGGSGGSAIDQELQLMVELSAFIPKWASKRGVTPENLYVPPVAIGTPQEETNRYLYFHFAPTLVYRDTYPVSGPAVDWLAVLKNLVNFILVVFFIFLIFRAFIEPQFAHAAERPGDLRAFVVTTFRSMMPALSSLVLFHFMILHSWMNLWAQLLRFGDMGHCYGRWWASTNWAGFYRHWNSLVGSWLKTYIYQDVIRFSKGSTGKSGATLWVFGLSAIVHEVVITYAMGSFYPILLCMFGGPGVVFVTLTKSRNPILNVFFWLMLPIGTGLLLVLYAHEYYATHGSGAYNIPGYTPPAGTWWEYAPRSWGAWYHRD